MPEMLRSELWLEKGIDRVTHVRRDDAVGHLPDGHLLPSRGDDVKLHIEELLQVPDTAQYLTTCLQPSVRRELLIPARFRAVLDDVRESFIAAAAQSADPRVLDRAIRLLNEDKGMRELVHMYRSALYQG